MVSVMLLELSSNWNTQTWSNISKSNYKKGFEKHWKATQTLFSVFVFKTISNSPNALVFIYINRKKVS